MRETIRYVKSECKDAKKVHLFLMKAPTAFVGLQGDDYPYVLPMAYVFWNNAFYMHGASEGKKNRLFTQNPNACINITEEYGSTIAPVPANIGTAYFSVTVYGKIEIVNQIEEATQSLQAMLDKYVPNYYAKEKPLKESFVEGYRSSLNSKTCTFKLIPERMTAKESAADISKSYFGGRTHQGDIMLNQPDFSLIGFEGE